MAGVLKLDRTVDAEKEDVEELTSVIRPAWDIHDITVQEITEGFVNSMWKVSNRKYQDDVIAVKIYGKENENLFDRQRELQLMEDLNGRDITPTLHARFHNGIAYKYIQGSTLSPQQLLDPSIIRLVIAKMHAIQKYKSDAFDNAQTEKLMQAIVDGWRAYAEAISEAPEFKEIFNPEEFSAAVEDVVPDFIQLRKDFPPCFCHNDMHVKNIIYDPSNAKIAVIDWEVAGMCYPVIDIARYLIICPDNSVYDSGILIPEKKEFIEQFVRIYLETRPDYGKKAVSQELVDKWLHGTYRAMENNLMITIVWGLMQWWTRSGRDFIGFVQKMEHLRRITVQILRDGFK